MLSSGGVRGDSKRVWLTVRGCALREKRNARHASVLSGPRMSAASYVRGARPLPANVVRGDRSAYRTPEGIGVVLPAVVYANVLEAQAAVADLAWIDRMAVRPDAHGPERLDQTGLVTH